MTYTQGYLTLGSLTLGSEAGAAKFVCWHYTTPFLLRGMIAVFRASSRFANHGRAASDLE